MRKVLITHRRQLFRVKINRCSGDASYSLVGERERRGRERERGREAPGDSVGGTDKHGEGERVFDF